MDDLNLTPVIRRPRRAPRIILPSPVPGQIGEMQVILHDISAIGAGIAHQQRIPRDFSGTFSFWWEGIQIRMQCSVVRTSLEKQQHGGVSLTVYHSGLVFEAVDAETRKALESKVADSLNAQNANATPAEPPDEEKPLFEMADGTYLDQDLNLNEYFPATMPESPLFVRCSLEGGRWVRKVVSEPLQPDEGFTLLAAESEDEIETLCWTYQETDRGGRNLIRTFAHLTVSGGF